MRSTVVPLLVDQLGERRRDAPGRLVDGGGRGRPPPPSATARARATYSRTRRRRNLTGGSTAASAIARSRRMRSTRNVRRSSRRWSWAARYQRPEWTTRPCGLSSRLVSSPENARYVPRTRRRRRMTSARRSTVSPRTGATLRAREVKSSVASSASTRRRRPSGRTRRIFQESTLGRLRRPGQPEPSRRLDSERDGHRLVVREHEQRTAVAGTDAVPTPDAALPLHRNAELLERADIATDRARVDLRADPRSHDP